MRKRSLTTLLFVMGILCGLLIFAVARELTFVFQAKPADIVLGEAISAIGSLRWVDTTLVTGLLAVGAAYFSIRAAHNQTKKTVELEADRADAKRTAVRAHLALALSSICNYARKSAANDFQILVMFDGNQLLPNTQLPNYDEVPHLDVSTVKEMIEFAEPCDRIALSKVAPAIQIHTAGVRRGEHLMKLGSTPDKSAVLSRIVDAAEVYARCVALFPYARREHERALFPKEQGIIKAIKKLMPDGHIDNELKGLAEDREEQMKTNGELLSKTRHTG